MCVQIDELYEAYCMQRRLRDGANKMVKAYTASPGSREARESLSEANKSFKEYTEVSGCGCERTAGRKDKKMRGKARRWRLMNFKSDLRIIIEDVFHNRRDVFIGLKAE